MAALSTAAAGHSHSAHAPTHVPHAPEVSVPATARGAPSRSHPAPGEPHLTVEEAKSALRHADAVVFDVDSTVIQVEGIDELAEAMGVGAKVAALTSQAMGGSMKFQDALRIRLEAINPTREGLASFVASESLPLTPGVEEFITALQARGVAVYFVSGGFTQMVYPVADRLKVPRERVFANTILFDEATGAYAGFDRSAPTSASGGKAVAVGRLKEAGGHHTVVMIGDGATDMEARPPATAFLGFGGVVERPVVKRGADWFVHSFEELAAELRRERGHPIHHR